jgi:cytochrome c-type biogenesis protein CcmH/NrfG
MNKEDLDRTAEAARRTCASEYNAQSSEPRRRYGAWMWLEGIVIVVAALLLLALLSSCGGNRYEAEQEPRASVAPAVVVPAPLVVTVVERPFEP